MGNIKLGYYLDASEVQILGPNPNFKTLPEVQFFALRDQGADVGNVLPLPASIQQWNDGILNGESVLVGTSKHDLYMIAEDINLGLSLFHYVYERENGSRLKLSDTLPSRTIQTERSIKIMSMNQSSLLSAARSGGAAQRMNLMDQNVSMTPVGNTTGGDGVTGATDIYRIQREALANSYVTGYIMGSAPAITLAMSKRKVKDSQPTFEIVAKESKPSRCLAVLIAMPARCCKKGGSLASPSDILAGMVDFNTSGEMVYQAFPVKAAISYIAALGGQLAEYAPFVSDARQQWSKEAILAEHPEVSYVRVHATENKSNKSGVQDRFRFSLRTTSTRRSLYTPKNIVCLRALEHMDIKCNSEDDAYRLNEAAFGGWRYRKPKTETETALEKAIHSCPDLIWQQNYTVDGQEVPGIGSAFFMASAQTTNAGGVPVMKRELSYWPWWQTGSLREEQPTQVKSMVKRVLQQAEAKKKERMVTIPILYKEKPDAKVFQQYRSFVDHIVSQGYISQDKLASMGGRASKGTRKKQVLTNDQQTSLLQFLHDEDVVAAVQSVQEASADRDVLASGK